MDLKTDIKKLCVKGIGLRAQDLLISLDSTVNIIVGGYVTVPFGKFRSIQDGLQISLRLNMASPSTFADQPKCRDCKPQLYFIANMKSNHCKTSAMGTKKEYHYYT